MLASPEEVFLRLIQTKNSIIMKCINSIKAIGVALVVMTGCSIKEIETPEVDITTVRCSISQIEVEEDFATGALDTLTATKATFEGTSFLWSLGDKIGIVPTSGAQIYFSVEDGAGTDSASFDGGDWAMKSTGTFYAYYPLYPDIFLTKDHVSVSYTGQTQNGNNNNLHTGGYWTLYTEGTKAVGNALNFSFNHLTSFFKTYVTVPAGTYTKITFSAPSKAFIKEGYFDLGTQTPTIVGTEFTDKLSLDLQNVTFTADTELTGYLVVAPVDIAGIPITVTVYKDGEAAYEYILTKANPMVAAKTYAFRATSLTQVASTVSQANAQFAAGATTVTIIDPLTEDASIVLPSTSEAVSISLPTTASTSTLTVSYPQNATAYPSTVSITGPEGSNLNIQAPNSTVTVNGVSYEHVTSRTAANTCIIPAGVNVNVLKVIQGGVQVFGTVSQIDLSEQEDDAIINVSGTVSSLLGEDDNEYTPVTGVSLNQSSINLNVGDTETLTASVAPVGAYPNVVWSSSDEAVATVSANGVVTAVAKGSAIITAKTISEGFTAICTITVDRQYVDLALPSGIMWATCNMGADNPEDAGSFFAWGETESKTEFSWSTYNYCNGSETAITKYCIISTNGTVDNKTSLDSEDDVAHVCWGGNWRMPTKDEFSELIENCTWTWTTLNGKSGYRVTGPNNNSIFLPTSGYKDGTTLKGSTSGYFWTSSLYMDKSSHGKRLSFNSNATNNGQAGRYYGFPVRPVYGEDPNAGVTGITLDRSSASLSIDESLSIQATVSSNVGAVNKDVYWSSSNPAVATVDHTGNVTAISAGNATITARTVFGGFTASCNITIEEEGAGFNWTPVSHSVVEPLGAYYSSSWFISDGVLYCEQGGKILTVDNNNHTITATINESNAFYDDRGSGYSTWTSLDGSVYSCFSVSESGYDDYYDLYRFENGEWSEIRSFGHSSNWHPQYMWKTNNYLYFRDGSNSSSSISRSSNGYNFSDVTMSNLPTNFSGWNVWTSASGTAYHSNGTSHYRFNESSLSWSQISASGWPSITAKDVFVVGSFTYWVSGGDCYMFNESSKTWTRIDNDFRAGLYGRYIWSYGGKYYYSDGTINKELKIGGQTFNTVSLLYFPSDYYTSNPPICNVHGNMIWSQYIKTPGTCVWNRLARPPYAIVTLSVDMSGQYYGMEEIYDDEEYETYYYMYPIDPTSGLRSSDYQYYGDGTTYYYAQSLWKDRNGVVHYDNDKHVFNDASGRCYYCCDSNGNSTNKTTHYRIYDETNGWGAPIPLNSPLTYTYSRNFWSDDEGNIYYTDRYNQYQLVPIE